MDHPSKIVSVNLNKSYGQPSSSSVAGHGRPRSGGGGMAVLSRSRGSASAGQKTTPRLAIPTPLNLPSLKKENARFEPSSSRTAIGHGISGIRSASGPSSTGWSKPAVPPAFQDNEISAGGQIQSCPSVMTVDQRAGSPYMPPSSRPAGKPVPVSPGQVFSGKAVILRGEDFPSLQATAMSVPKQKEFLNQKQRQKQVGEEHLEGRAERFESRVPLEMPPKMRSSRASTNSVLVGDVGSSRPSGASEHSRKEDRSLSGLLPLVRLQHTSDWADDERDTALRIPERDRNRRNSRSESVHVHVLYDGMGMRGTEAGGASSREFARGDVIPSTKEGRDVGSWRAPLQQRDRLGTQELGVDGYRDDTRSFGASREMVRETNNGRSHFGDDARDGKTLDSWYAGKNLGSGINTQNGRSVAEAFSGKGVVQNTRGWQGCSPSNWNRGNSFQNNLIPRSSLSSGSKGLSLNDPIRNLAREKRLAVDTGVKPYIDDSGFDSRDPFSGGIGHVNVKLFKRKKDTPNQSDFHDPVRESFEAEMESILRMREQECERVMEEQARVLELARKEEEERERLAREEKERRRLLEEEAREAARRAEQERLEAASRAEEQRIAREEEKRRTLVEEERRKEAARQKLLELEVRIARRQAEANAKDDSVPSVASDEVVPGLVKERDAPRVADVGGWEEGERMVQCITSSASPDSSSMNIYFDPGSKPYSSRDGNPAFTDGGIHAYHWTCGNNSSLPSHNQENIYKSPKRDSFGSRRGFANKELHGGSGMMSLRPSNGGNVEHSQIQDGFSRARGQRWSGSRDGVHFNRNSDVDADFLDNDKFGDVGWGPGNSHGRPHSPYSERQCQKSEVDGLSSFTRVRHSLKQPHAPPPPSMTSMHRSSYRPADHVSSSLSMDRETRYHHASRIEQQIRQTGYDRVYQENIREPGTIVLAEENGIHFDHNEENNGPRCDSRSSLSFSSPPCSPMPPSHDEMDVSGDSPALPPSADGERTVSSDNEHIESALEAANLNVTVTLSSVSRGEDDEWAIENHEEMQEQEEYDEDNNYHEAVEGDNENLDLGQEFKHLQSDVQNKAGEMDQVIIGFNEGVEVKIPSNDELEMIPRNSERATKQVDSPGSVEEMISNGLDRLKADNALLEGSASSSLKVINVTEKARHDLVLDPVAPSIYPHESVEASRSSGMPAQNPMASLLSVPMPSTSMILPATVATQGEVPVNLQFGLFSGPSLIPSPVPAIQIGSIQMPIHLHAQVGPSLAPMHPSQSPVFQFGQLRYSPPICQSVLSHGPQSPTSASYSLIQNPSGYLLDQGPQNSSQNNLGDGMPSSDNQANLAQKILDLSPGTLNSEQLNAFSDSPKKEFQPPMNQTYRTSYGGKKATGESASQIDRHDNQDGTSKKKYRPIAHRESQNQPNTEPQSSRFSSGGKAATVSKAPGNVSGSRGKRFAYSVKNAGSKLSFSRGETLHTDSGGFHGRTRRNNGRSEFRFRENFERKQTQGTELFYHARLDDRPSLNGRASGISVRSAGKKDVISNRLIKMMNEPDNLNSGASSSQVASSKNKTDKATEAVSKSIASADKTHGPKETLKTNGSEEDVDAPLQSGVVRIFKQPGIEAPSDEDNFIEVRSKRQMLNDKREQREKEIKSRSRLQKKVPHKQHSIPQSSSTTSSSNKAAASLGGDAEDSVRPDLLVTERRGFASVESSHVFMAITTSQTLPPIGTPSVNVDSETRSNNMKSNQTVPAPVMSTAVANLVPDSLFDSKNVAADNASLPLGSWDSANLNKVMALTQVQLDEAMKPAQFDSRVASSMVLEPHKPIASIMTQEKPVCSSTSPIDSLLAGEKIQFGAVTSTTILPPVSRTISNGVGPPGSCRLDVKIGCNLPAAGNECNMFFDKEKHPDEPCPNLEDPEAEAEAAASAVAVAAISNDEMVGSGIGACSASASGTKSFSSADITGLAAGGMTTNQEVTGQSAGEEFLTVALPADLSVDTPLSLWPPLPSPQSSGPMLSHFPGASPSHFPCLEMSPMLGGRIFSFGSHDELGGIQGQSQRSAALGSGPVGPWPQCPSGVDSFYGPPAGFAGPFIGPGGIPGVQSPPHMVVYNHFAPVGQFGQVGLSFMGTSYIPTGKQPNWKHNPASSNVGDIEGNLNNLNFVSDQCTSHSIPTPLQHLGLGSPLMPIASPLTTFNISPFQSSADIPMQAGWSHVPAPPLNSVPPSMPLQVHHVEGRMLLQYNHSLPIEASNANNKFHEPRSSILDDGTRNIPVQSSSTSEFSGGLGLVEQPTSSNSQRLQTLRPSYNLASGNNSGVSSTTKTSTRTTVSDGNESRNIGETGNQTSGPSSKTQQSTLSGQQYLPPIGHADQQNGASQKTGSMGEWHRRTGFQGRNQGSSADKNFGSGKMKQIYVAKSSSGPANPG